LKKQNARVAKYARIGDSREGEVVRVADSAQELTTQNKTR